MSDLALYRKYRPQKFSEVKGQEQVVEVIMRSLKDEKVAHAYLFAGPRGTGKTSIARIFAAELGTAPSDIYEIDGASNRNIDDVRALRDEVRTLPFDSKYKVYIIDEVHMFTKEAFNALLKTLEEPPAHVIFILATTELHKVPETIVSRCQTFVFKKPSQDILQLVVASAAKKEGFSIEKEASALIALLGDGSFRDTLGALQKVLSGVAGEKVSVEDVERITGAPRAELVRTLLRAFIEKNAEKAILAVRSATAENIEMKTYLKLVMHELRLGLLFKFAPALKKEIGEELSKDEADFQEELAQAIGTKDTIINSTLLRELIDVYADTDKSHIPSLPLELAIMKLLPKS
ncbi:MAG: DNA polymerase III subunit gamma/tau [Patescibacteria group bacterium]